MFITFEGIEGSGKTTQINLLVEWLRSRNLRVLVTREPGGTAIGDQIRHILLHPAHTEMAAEAEILLFSAARAQIVRQVIRPHLDDGWIVVCDRFADSTMAYQGYGQQLPLDALRQITNFATGGLSPDITFYLDIAVETGLRRKAQTPEEWNRMEALALDFHHRVRAGYLTLVNEEPRRFRVVDAGRDTATVQNDIRGGVGAAIGIVGLS